LTKVLSILAHKKRMPHYAVREVGLRAPSIVIRAYERTNRMIEERTGRLAVARFIAPPILGILAACVAVGGCSSSNPAVRASAEPGTAAAMSEGEREQRVRALQQAEALYLSGRLKEAQAAFEQLTRTYPRNAEIWFRYGNTMMKQGNYDDAAAALQNALAFDPGHGKAALNLALARLAQAQAALVSASAHLPADSAERRQADELAGQVRLLVGAPGGEARSR
jgi:tetratricopeptide (TPR) repeat protein